MRMQPGIFIAEDRIIDSVRVGNRQHRIAQRRHIHEKLPLILVRQVIEIIDNRVRQQ